MGDVVFAGFWADSENHETGDTPDLRLVQCMVGTTVESEPDALTCADFTDVNELDGTGYSTGDPAGVAITYEAASVPPEQRYDWSDDADGWGTTVAPGSDDVEGTLVVRWVTTLADSIPWFYTTQNALSPNGGNYGWTVPATGFVNIHIA